MSDDVIDLDSRRKDPGPDRVWANARILRESAARLGHRPFESYLWSFPDADVRDLGDSAFGPTANRGYPSCYPDCAPCASGVE